MIKSMTGFGAGDCENDEFKFHIEIKAVNQRYLETNYHMHYTLAVFENDVTKIIKEYINRGKLDISVIFLDKRESNVKIQVDMALARAYKSALDEISEQLGIAKVTNPVPLANYENVLKLNQDSVASSLDGCRPILMAALDEALKNLVIMRENEGRNIQADILSRVESLERYTDELEKLAPQIVEQYRQRLDKLIAEILDKDEIDEARIIQEVGIYSDKINYTEELVRLRSHFAQLKKLLYTDEPVGRRIDFLIQEMNREINTVASKASSAGASQMAVDVKAEIEKIREQIQNVE